MPLPFKDSYLYLIGINDYDNSIGKLRSPVQDTNEIEKILTAAPHHFTVRRPADNSYDAITTMLENMKNEVKQNDRVLFYFAGHGITMKDQDGTTEGYIIPGDGKLDQGGRGWISMKDLLGYFTNLPCRHCLLILDCCFAGSIIWADYQYRDVRIPPKLLFKEHFDFYTREKAWQVIVSAAFDQTAKDIGWRCYDSRTVSPFVEALLKGLSGKADFSSPDIPADGIITVTELSFFLRQEIQRSAALHKIEHCQTPALINLRQHDKGEYIFLNPAIPEQPLPSALPAIRQNNPFKGLQGYNEGDELRFFGRDRVIKTMLDRLAADRTEETSQGPLLIVSGISGSGKSSVVGAGLVPALKRKGWTELANIRPGEFPQKQWNRVPKTPPRSPSFLIIDQLEEIVTHNKNKEHAEAFKNSIAGFHRAHPQVAIIMTLRADFEHQVLDGPDASLWSKHVYHIPWFERDELRDVLVRPAANIAFFYHPAPLVDRIIDEVLQYPGSLPMLSTLLSELYLRSIARYPGNPDYKRLLLEEDYISIGGVPGALQSQLGSLQKDNQNVLDVLRHILLRMVDIEGGIYTRKKADHLALEYPRSSINTRMTATIDLLVEHRVLTPAEGGIQAWEPVHDAVVRWKELGTWIETIGTERMAIQTELENDIRTYYRNDRKPGDLWYDNSRLDTLFAEITGPSNESSFPLNITEIAFIHDSHQLRERKQKRRRLEIRIAIGVLSILLVAAVIFAVQSNSNARIASANAEKARRNQDTAESNARLANEQTEKARQALYQFERERYFTHVQNGDEYMRSFKANALAEYLKADSIAGRYPKDDSVLNSGKEKKNLQDKITTCRRQTQ